MQRALCNATAEGEKGHMHICSLEHTGKDTHGKVHLCRCGTLFASVKKSDIERAGQKLEKTQ